MAALASTLMAVSVTVLAPQQAPATPHSFVAPADATLGQAVEQWSKESGLAAPQIDARVASLSVGTVSVAGGDICQAVGRLVAALKYADQRPQLQSCGATGVVLASAR